MAKDTILFLLDNSGSMQGQEAEIVSSVNQVLKDMQVCTAKQAEGFSVLIYTFNTKHILIRETTLQSDPQIRLNEYMTSGGTLLYDTLGRILSDIVPNSTVVIATDGEDTMSVEYTKDDILQEITRAKTELGVEFIFVAKGIEAFTGGEKIGLGGENAFFVNDFSSSSFMPVSASISLVAFRHTEINQD